jgi:dipeptidyl aminopeptidase/acylaminoacyl peptidase
MPRWCSRFYAHRLKQVSIWVFHGEDDGLVPVHETEELVEALRGLNAEVKTSLVAGRNHVPPSIDEHKELFDWFLKHRRNTSKIGPPE